MSLSVLMRQSKFLNFIIMISLQKNSFCAYHMLYCLPPLQISNSIPYFSLFCKPDANPPFFELSSSRSSLTRFTCYTLLCLETTHPNPSCFSRLTSRSYPLLSNAKKITILNMSQTLLYTICSSSCIKATNVPSPALASVPHIYPTLGSS